MFSVKSHNTNSSSLIGLLTLVLMLPLLVGPIKSAAAQTTFTREARVIELDEAGVANPTGLAFSPRAGAFYVISANGKSQPSPTSMAIASLTPFAQRIGSTQLAAALSDPINITFDSHFGRLLLLQSSAKQLLVVAEDADGQLDARSLTRYSMSAFDVADPVGVAVDGASGALLILDAAGPALVRITPQANGSFNNATITRIDLQASGLTAARGLALDPASGNLHSVDTVGKRLVELTPNGQLVAARSLAEYALVDPQGIVFAPSGDTTDDPQQLSLYLADAGAVTRRTGAATAGQIVEISFVAPPARQASTYQSSLVQTINAYQWSPASPDSAGIVYLPDSNHLLVTDSEVNEMPIFAGANAFESTLTGTLLNTFNTLSFSDEPTGISVNPANKHLFISDDTGAKKIYELDPGPDMTYSTGDDSTTAFSTSDFGSNDPEGVVYVTDLNALFIADGVNNEVYMVTPGNNGIFDGVAPSGDDQVSSFDTFNMGMDDPEGLTYDPASGHLYIAGRTLNVGSGKFDTLLEVTPAGVLVQLIDVSSSNAVKLSGLTYGPRSNDPGAVSIYIVDRGVDNNSDPNENDGRIYEMTMVAPANMPPQAADDSVVTSQNVAIAIDVAANDSDPDGNLDPTTTNILCGGCSGTSSGTLDNNGDGTFDYTPNGGFTGSDGFTYEICDSDGLCDSADVVITVTQPNFPPTANDDTLAVDEDVPTQLNVAANDSDPDGNLDVASTNNVCFDCTSPTNGTLVNNGNGSFDYTPDLNFNGGDSFIYEICDILGACSTALVTINVNPIVDPPVAIADSAATTADTAVVIDVAANDSDPDGNLNPASASTTCPTCSSPSHGSLINHGNGTFTYSPNSGYTGSDSFIYEICDSGGLCATAAVDINISDQQIMYVSSTSGGSVGGVSFKDEDILIFDFSSDTWSMYFDGSDVGLYNTGQELGALHVYPDGSFLFSPVIDDVIPDIGAVDDSDIIRFIPATTGETTAGTFEMFFDGSDVDLTTSTEDIDAIGFAPDGRLLLSFRGSYSVVGASGGDEDLIAFSETSFGPNTSGSWELYFDGSAASLDIGSEDVNGTWLDGNGDIYLSVRGSFSVPGVNGDASDIFTCVPSFIGAEPNCSYSMFWQGDLHGFGSESIGSFFIGTSGASNSPPIAAADSVVTSQNTGVTIDVAANDSDPDDNLDATTTNIGCAGCSGSSSGTLQNNGDGTFDYTPNSDYTGPDGFTYEICDNEGLCDSAAVDITVTVPNVPPNANDDNVATDEDTPLNIDVAANDSDADGNLDLASANILCFDCSSTTDGALVNQGNGVFAYTPNQHFNGSDGFIYEICDTLGACSTALVSITVDPVADPPLANADSASTQQDMAVMIAVADNDSDPDNDLVLTSTNNSCGGCSSPTNGSLQNNGDGSFSYTPNSGFTGSDSFTYEICDSSALCATAVVDITVTGQQMLYLASSSGGTVAGIRFRDEDILTYDFATDSWALYFDGSDVTLDAKGQEIDALHVNADGSFLFSLAVETTLPDIGLVDDSDIIRFVPTSTGTTTAGTFSLYFDGSDVDLTENGEDIDAIALAPDGRIIMSFRSSFNVSGVAGGDEDMVAFTSTSLGDVTSGSWELYFNGSTAALDTSSEDINATWIDGNGDIFLSVRGPFIVPGVGGDDSDIFTCTPSSVGVNTICSYSAFWDGSAHGFDGENLNALSVGSSESVSLPTPVTLHTVSSDADQGLASWLLSISLIGMVSLLLLG